MKIIKIIDRMLQRYFQSWLDGVVKRLCYRKDLEMVLNLMDLGFTDEQIALHTEMTWNEVRSITMSIRN